MTLIRRPYADEDDYWRIRALAREALLLNGGDTHSEHVADLDHWRWHLIGTCAVCGPPEQVTFLWETPDVPLAEGGRDAGGFHGEATASGQHADDPGDPLSGRCGARRLVAALHSMGEGEVRLLVHPRYRSAPLEDEMLACAEATLYAPLPDGERRIFLPIDAGDLARQTVALERGYVKGRGTSRAWRRDLTQPIPESAIAPGYVIRSMGGASEHPARSWASWRAFHDDEPDDHYDGDWTWYANIQSAPLYRRDLDVVAVDSESGDIASFATLSYDDTTRSAMLVLVGTAAGHRRRGLARAVILEAFRRAAGSGATLALVVGHDPPANGLYGAVMDSYVERETWRKVWSER